MAVSWPMHADLEVRGQHAAVFLTDRFVLDLFTADREKNTSLFHAVSFEPSKIYFLFGYNLFPCVVSG